MALRIAVLRQYGTTHSSIALRKPGGSFYLLVITQPPGRVGPGPSRREQKIELFSLGRSAIV